MPVFLARAFGMHVSVPRIKPGRRLPARKSLSVGIHLSKLASNRPYSDFDSVKMLQRQVEMGLLRQKISFPERKHNATQLKYLWSVSPSNFRLEILKIKDY